MSLTRIAQKVLRDREPFLRVDDERMYVLLQDGREISVPLWWYPRLLHATPAQRNNWEVLSFGDALHRPGLIYLTEHGNGGTRRATGQR